VIDILKGRPSSFKKIKPPLIVYKATNVTVSDTNYPFHRLYHFVVRELSSSGNTPNERMRVDKLGKLSTLLSIVDVAFRVRESCRIERSCQEIKFQRVSRP